MQMSLDVAMERTFSVGEFGQLINDVLGHAFPHDVWIQGEVRDMNRANSGHVYFNVVDPPVEPGRPPGASLAVVLFEGTKRTVNNQIKRSGGGMRIDDGVSIRLRGTPDFYSPGGKLSLRMTGIDPAYTLGQMAASRDRLLRLLAEEGLMDANKGLRFPAVPLRIGLVTAANSAAQADFIDELRASGISFQVVFAAATVQGPDAPRQLAAAVEACARSDVDVTAVVRGGGARTDLAAFDDEIVARAIARSSVPVVTGIGHEIDRAVADDMAHASFKTPTAVAAHLVQCNLVAEQAANATWHHIAQRASLAIASANSGLDTSARSVGRAARAALRASDDQLVSAARRACDLTVTQLERSDHRLSAHVASARVHGRHRLQNARAQLDRQTTRLDEVTTRRLDDAANRLDQASLRARLLDPARVLARGWTITTDADGNVIRSVGDVASGTNITTRVADGTVRSTVTESISTPEEDQ